MRLKKIPRASEYIEQHPKLAVTCGQTLQGNWQSFFEKSQPLHIEIGMGKGGFVNSMANLNPATNFIGIELYDSVLLRALEKLVANPLPNLRLLQADAADLATIFTENEISKIYLNFSDPWPKTRHAKRRLTHERFLHIYQQILVNNGELQLKTDNRSLFEYSVLTFNHFGIKFSDISLDLHANIAAYPDNVMTEYEQKFSALGHPIYLLKANL